MMKNKLMLACLAGLCAVLLCGCVRDTVPQTQITGALAGAPFAISSPKDSVLEDLEVSAQQNGVVRIKIGRLTAKMNPEVITTTADGQAKLISTAVAAGAAVAGQVGGAALK